VDSLYLPGGYPELHHHALAANAPMLEAIRAHHAQGKPLLAECGGMLYLLDALTDVAGERAALLGLLPGEATMQKRLAALALQAVDCRKAPARAHLSPLADQHHAGADRPWPEPQRRPWQRSGVPPGPADRLLRAFLLPSNPDAAAALLRP
jgi:cobyrinic acid a,c-diamide synthase